jgi:hypothetical protein
MFMELTSQTVQGIDKIKRYGWTLEDEPGRFRYIRKELLLIHPSYQRDLITQKVSEISSSWSWIGCGVLVVAERAGQLWVIDGHHRHSAALRRSDIDSLPCIVFSTNDVKSEATGFLILNTLRKPITAMAKQKALVAAEDPTAEFVQKTCDGLGIKITSAANSPNTMKCISWCIKRAKEDRETFALVLSAAQDISNVNGVHIQEKLLEGLWVMHNGLPSGIFDRRLFSKLMEKGALKLIAAANKASAYYASGGGQVWAGGMLDEVNKGLRNRFSMEKDDVDG